MLTIGGTRNQRAFWTVLVAAWLVMLAISALTHEQHVLIVSAWGILWGLLGISMLVDRRRVFHAYRRALPTGVSVAQVRRIVLISAIVLTFIGILVTALGCVKVWREWSGL